MTSTKRAGPVVLRLATSVARHRLSVTALLVLLGAVLSTSVVGFHAIDNSSDAAIVESVRAGYGHRSYALESDDPSVARIMAARPDAGPVTDQATTLTASGLSIDVLVRSTTDPGLELGVLVVGRRPVAAGEAVISEVLADSLEISIGDQVTLGAGDGSTKIRVTGLVIDPENASARWVFRLVTGDSAEFRPRRWLMDTNLARDPNIGAVLNRTATRIASVESAVPLALENKPPALTALGFFPAGAGLVLGCLVVGAIAALGRRWPKDAAALQASGFSARIAWQVFVVWVASSVLAGQVAGSVGAILALRATKGAVSGWIGQDWSHVAAPVVSGVVIVVVTATLVVVVVPVAVELTLSRPGPVERKVAKVPWLPVSRRRQGRNPVWLITLAVLSAAMVLWVYISFISTRDASHMFAIAVGCVLAAASPFIVSRLVAIGLPRATRTLFRALVGGVCVAVAVATMVTFLAGTWSAETYYAANRGDVADNPMQPKLSLVVADVPNSSVALIGSLYGRYGGEHLTSYQLTGESGGQLLRATSPKLAACVDETGATNPNDLDARCWPDSLETATPINTVALGPAGSRPVADPGLMADGTVGLLILTPGTRDPITGTAATPADTDSRLGGLLPGLVVPADSALVTTHRLSPSGVSIVLLADYGRLSPSDRLRLRAEIARISPTAALNDSTAPSHYDQRRSQAATAGVFGAVAAGLLLLLGGYSSVQTTASARRLIQDLGTRPGLRWSLVARWLTVPVFSVLATGSLAYLTASFGGRASDSPYGPWWVSPAVVALMTTIVLGAWFVRPIRKENDAD